jgi:hypothetical protein
MSVAAIPGFVKPRFARFRRQVPAVAARLLNPARPVLRNLASVPFTVAGWGLLSAAAFEVHLIAGLAVTGVILMVLEHQIADEP